MTGDAEDVSLLHEVSLEANLDPCIT